jgi:thiol reductant ABC exporter CydC subunit
VNATLPSVLRLANVPRARLTLAVLLGALTVLFGVGLMATAGYLISRAAERPAVLSLMVAIVAVRVFGLGRPVMRYLERLASHDLALRMLGRIRARFYARVEPLAPAELECYRSGDLLSRMVADVDALQNIYLQGVGPALVSLLAGAVSVGVATAFLPAAGVVLGAGLLAGGLLVPAFSGFVSRRAGCRQAAARGELSAELVELVGGAPEIIAFGAESAALARIRAIDGTLVSAARRDALATGAADGLGLLVAGVTTAGVLALAVDSVHEGRLDRVLVAVLALLTLASFEAVTPLAAAARALSSTVAAGRRILELTDRDATVLDRPEPAPGPAWPFAIALEGVRARYPGQPHPVLDALDLTLAPGEHVALVGPSGVGKTTVTNLLLRFLDPEEGRVTLAGRDVRDYRQEDVRHAIAVAGQDSHLFTTSIRDNVRLARPDASGWEIEQALRRARIWEWISRLPQGLDTVVGEQGRELSGGQRQRIVLARALLTDAPVMVLDEPTAHLDPSTAGDLMCDVLATVRDKAVLLITHRTEGLDLVDRVVSLERPDGTSTNATNEVTRQ